jgi:hypothetical protein
VQFVAPSSAFGAACSFEHGVQSAEPGAPLKVPLAHGAQSSACTEPASEVEPAAQRLQAAAPAAENAPAGHVRQAAAPEDDAKEPAAQRKQTPEERLEPAGHMEAEADGLAVSVGAAERDAEADADGL